MKQMEGNMSSENLLWYTFGELNNNIMLIELGVRDLAEIKVRVEHKNNILDILSMHKVYYKFVEQNETFLSLCIWKNEIVGSVIERIDKIEDPILLSYINAKLYGYGTKEIIVSEH